MRNLLFDTNIVISLIRSNDISRLLAFLMQGEAKIYISVATFAEIKTFAQLNQWGRVKIAKLEHILSQVYVIEITEHLVPLYVEIDTYSQLRNPNFTSYPFSTHRNMGKNDLWIAATAAFLNLSLVTTDLDFNHLHNTFLDLKQIDANEIRQFM